MLERPEENLLLPLTAPKYSSVAGIAASYNKFAGLCRRHRPAQCLQERLSSGGVVFDPVKSYHCQIEFLTFIDQDRLRDTECSGHVVNDKNVLPSRLLYELPKVAPYVTGGDEKPPFHGLQQQRRTTNELNSTGLARIDRGSLNRNAMTTNQGAIWLAVSSSNKLGRSARGRNSLTRLGPTSSSYAGDAETNR